MIYSSAGMQKKKRRCAAGMYVVGVLKPGVVRGWCWRFLVLFLGLLDVGTTDYGSSDDSLRGAGVT